jgi:hypothetical protein
MKANAPTTNVGQVVATNFDVKEQDFAQNPDGTFEKGIPLASKYNYDAIPGRAATPTRGAIAAREQRKGNAIGEYLIPPNSGTYVLGSVDGNIQWIATEDCDA